MLAEMKQYVCLHIRTPNSSAVQALVIPGARSPSFRTDILVEAEVENLID